MTNLFLNTARGVYKPNKKIASASKRPRSENLSAEEVSDLLFAGDEDHLGMWSDEESEIDRELDFQSGVSR